MYFNDRKEDTNIDDEFDDLGGGFFNKIKKILLIGIIIVVALLIVVIIIIKANNRTNYYLELDGEENIIIFKGVNYIYDNTYHAWSDDSVDLSNEVVIDSNLNTNVIGEYKITYKFHDITRERTITVVERTGAAVIINLRGVSPMTIHTGDRFKDPGIDSVVDYTGENIPNTRVKVVIIDSATQQPVSSINTSKEGIYRIKYSVSNSKGDTANAESVVKVESSK